MAASPSRLALAIAYDGTRFDSYARQPGHRTVEGELLRILGPALATPALLSGSRTDKGVSAAWNVVAIDSHWPARRVAALDARLPEGLHIRSVVEVPPGFNPRHARRRVYRYLLDRRWDWARVAPMAKRLRGEHDFSNFRKADEGVAPTARLDAIRYRATRPGPWLEFEAPSFLWHQVRRIVAALAGVESGDVAPGIVARALDEPHRRVDLGLARPEPLVLVRVDYPHVDFPPPLAAAHARLADALAVAERRLRWTTLAGSQAPGGRV